MEELQRMARVGNPVASPDGTMVAFVVRQHDAEAGKPRRDLFLASTITGAVQRVTRSASASSPTFSTDGTSIFFTNVTSNGTGTRQVFALDLANAEAGENLQLSMGDDGVATRTGSSLPVAQTPYQVTFLPLSVLDLMLLPFGDDEDVSSQALAVTVEVAAKAFHEATDAGKPDLLQFTAAAEAKRKVDRAAGEVFDEVDCLPYSHWDQVNPYRLQQRVLVLGVARAVTGVTEGIPSGPRLSVGAAATRLAAADYERGGAAGEVPSKRVGPWVAGGWIDLLEGAPGEAECPPRPFGGLSDSVACAPGAEECLLVMRPPEKRREWMWSTGTAVYRMPLPIHILASDACDVAEALGVRAASTGSSVPAAAAARAEAGRGLAVPALPAPSCLTRGKASTHWAPAFSEDLSVMAWLAMDRPGFESDAGRLCVARGPTSHTRAFHLPTSPTAAVTTPVVGSPTVEELGVSRAVPVAGEIDLSFSSLKLVSSRLCLVEASVKAHRCLAFVLLAKATEPERAAAAAAHHQMAMDARVACLDLPGSASGASVLVFDPAGSGLVRLVFSMSSLERPAELYMADVSVAELEAAARAGVGPENAPLVPAANLRRLTGFNDGIVRNLLLSRPRNCEVTVDGGDKVQYWVLPPVKEAVEEDDSQPVLLMCHGGPQGCWGNDWHYRHNIQLYAAAGFWTVVPNFHGSSSFGQAFTDSISGDWAGQAMADCVAVLDHAVATCASEGMDGHRAAVMGASFGGYTVAELLGSQPDRFRCAVSHAGICDTRSFALSTEELWFPEWDLRSGAALRVRTPWQQQEEAAGGDPSSGAGCAEACNPLRNVHKWKTPTLVIQGGQDMRVPTSQALILFTALQRQGVPSKLLHFPTESHWIAHPRNAVVWQDRVLGWLSRWCCGIGAEE